MKNLGFAVLTALAALSTPALAQKPEHWAGMAIIETMTQTCYSYGPQVGQSFEASIMPLQAQVSPGPWSNNGSHIRLSNDSDNMSYNIFGSLTTNLSPQPAALSRIIRAGGAYGHPVTMERLTVTPANISSSTPEITLRMTVTNFYGTPDCTVRLRVKGIKVPEEQGASRGMRTSAFKR